MSSDWMKKATDAAKHAAEQATEQAKKLAESAKNVNYGELIDKTKNAAMHAADEAKKAASNVMHKNPAEESPATSTEAVAMTSMPPEEQKAKLYAKLEQVEKLLQEIKDELKGSNQ